MAVPPGMKNALFVPGCYDFPVKRLGFILVDQRKKAWDVACGQKNGVPKGI